MDFDMVLHGEKAGKFVAFWTICASREDMRFLQQHSEREGRVSLQW
jgi:hypothetical protein